MSLLNLYQINPCRDDRWPSFVENHPSASIFHTTGWLEALQRTYGYEPVVYTTCAPETKLTDGVVFTYINSWLTGKRLVSLPFSDHAAPLLGEHQDLGEILAPIISEKQSKRRYVEIRPTSEFSSAGLFQQTSKFYWHRLALDPDLDSLLQKFHKSCVQRNIRRAIRERLEYVSGNSDVLLRHFYGLLSLSHRRHRIPPQPFVWFRNVMQCLGEKANIRIAFQNGSPVAGLLTLSFKKSIVYKYGGSDDKYHYLGGMPFLFWQTIQEAKQGGFAELDLGRSESDNAGLVKFKEHWGAHRYELKYWRYSAKRLSGIQSVEMKTAKRVFGYVPSSFLPVAGRLLYRHIG